MTNNSLTENDKWEIQRKNWITPNSGFDSQKYTEELNTTHYQDLVDPVKRLGIFKQLVQNSLPFIDPVPLRFIIPVLTTGWEKEGTWSKDMVEDSE